MQETTIANQQQPWGKDVFTLLSWFEIDKVKNAKVMVVGAGALGNEVLKNLALFGVGHIVIVDFDKIEYSNLTRSILFRPEDADKGYYKAEIAAKRLKEINPTIEVEAICGDLAADVGLGIYRRMDVVIGCLDNVWARILLNKQCFRVDRIWIEGGIGDLQGQVSGYKLGVNCYRCSLEDEFTEEEAKISFSCHGDIQMNEEHGRLATTPISASIIAAIQTQEAMKIIHKEAIEKGRFISLVGGMFRYEGASNYAASSDFSPYYDDCPDHEYWNNIKEVPTLSADCPIKDALAILRNFLKAEQVEINMLNNKFVKYLYLKDNPNKTFQVSMPFSKITEFIKNNDELVKEKNNLRHYSYENINENEDEFPYQKYQQYTLKQMGIPYFDIIQVTTEKGTFYVELSADKQRYKTILE